MHVCVGELECVGPSCTIHVWGIWLCPDCQNCACRCAHVQLQCKQKQEHIQTTSNTHGCLAMLICTCPVWANMPGHTDTPFIFSTIWKKDRSFIFQWKCSRFAQVWCADWRQVCREQAAGHGLTQLARVSPLNQYFLFSCEMKEMHMWRKHSLCWLNGSDYTLLLGMFNSWTVQGAVYPRSPQKSLYLSCFHRF